jgi:hypothetical protein
MRIGRTWFVATKAWISLSPLRVDPESIAIAKFMLLVRCIVPVVRSAKEAGSRIYQYAREPVKSMRVRIRWSLPELTHSPTVGYTAYQ